MERQHVTNPYVQHKKLLARAADTGESLQGPESRIPNPGTRITGESLQGTLEVVRGLATSAIRYVTFSPAPKDY